MPCRWGSRATRAKLTMISNFGLLGAVENDEKSRRVLGPEPFTKHAPEFEIIRTLLLPSLFPTTLGNSVGAIRRDI